MSAEPPLQRLKARLLILSLFVMIAWGAPMALFFFAIDYAVVGWVSLAMSAASILPLYFSKRSGKYRMIGHYLCTSSMVTLVIVSLATGGMGSLAVYWLIVPVLYAHVFIDSRAAFYWAIGSILAMGGIAAAEAWGGVAATRVPDELRPTVVFFSAASLIGLTSITLAINSRLQEWAEASLKRTQQRMLEATREGFQTLVENTPDGVLVHRNHVIRYANPAAARCLAVEDVEALIGETVDEYLTTDSTWEPIDEGDHSPHRANEQLLRREDGSEIPVELTQFHAPVDGESSTITVMRDLTTRREMRAQIMRLDRMAAVGTLAAGVGHEINNPLAFVIGNLEFVQPLTAELIDQEGASERDVSEISDALSDALEGAQRIQRIVADLRTFARDDNPEPVPTDVRDSIESALKMASNEIQHRATLVRDYDDVPHVFADDATLGQVILNLLINAAHAISTGGADHDTVTVRTRYRDGVVQISVSDTGTGMSADVRARIFDPFYTTKSPDNGTGLGLAVCQNIIQGLGGTIDVESEPGEGSTFTVSLPPVAGSDHEEAGEGASAVDLFGEHSVRLLIIDDEPAVCRMLERTLPDRFDTVSFQRADDALAALQDGLEVDVILTDLLMPEQSGVSFYASLSETVSELDDHIVFMTGGAFTSEAKAFVENVDVTVLRKPCDTDTLLDALDNAASPHGLSSAS
ncbi:MAG: ATP-binding protein [Myxococcota bacterium]